MVQSLVGSNGPEIHTTKTPGGCKRLTDERTATHVFPVRDARYPVAAVVVFVQALAIHIDAEDVEACVAPRYDRGSTEKSH